MRNIPKELKFPLSGLAHDLNYRDATLPTEERTYATPMAKNVIGSCAFSERLRGGSRPGLKSVSGASASNVAKWLWPNGEPIKWPGEVEKDVAFGTLGTITTLSDGSRILNQHETFSVAASKGAIPSALSCCAFYRDRMVVAADTMWYASRIGAKDDFDYGAGEMDDTSRAVAGNVALAGRKGEAITALAAVNDAALFIATKRALWMVSGDPTGGMKPISEFVGIVSANAWCFDGQRVFFIGPNGLYGMTPGESPLMLSARLPFDLKGFASATLVYDPDKRGIHIFATTEDAAASDWFFEIESKAFWPMVYNAAIRPTGGGVAMVDGVNKVVFSGADGNAYCWDEDTAKDAGTYEISSEIALGPFRCGLRDDNDGMLAEVFATLAKDSASVSMSVYTARDAEGAVKAVSAVGSTAPTYTLSAGFNRVIRTRQRGAWAVVVLRGTGKWAYESLLANIRTLGRLR